MAKENDTSPQVFDVERVRQLIELMNEHQLNEIDLRQVDRRIRLRRGIPSAPAVYAAPPVGYAAPAAAPAATAVAPAAKAPAEDANAVFIKSPMVGTFYSKPKPTAASYIKVGDVVQADTIVCLIEAMKTFNELPAGVAGKIVAILVKEEEPVDVNKPLFKIVPQ
jgi:acetyl-CoA carboxylase biotin carboxyl carrier protein